MPKIVDHEQRRQHIAEATWQVILKHGIEGATVRQIAKEANLTLGSLRHYFASQEELLIYAMKLVKERATHRVAAIVELDLPPAEKVMRILLELVPTNEQTVAEMQVWLAFTVYARHKITLFDALHDGIYTGIKQLILYMDKSQLLRSGLDLEIESEKLYAIVDGIALHAFLDPHRLTSERIVSVLQSYLASIMVDG